MLCIPQHPVKEMSSYVVCTTTLIIRCFRRVDVMSDSCMLSYMYIHGYYSVHLMVIMLAYKSYIRSVYIPVIEYKCM